MKFIMMDLNSRFHLFLYKQNTLSNFLFLLSQFILIQFLNKKKVKKEFDVLNLI
jgi:hypothetical protein